MTIRGLPTKPSSFDSFSLILVDGHLSDERIDRIRHRLYEVEWESGEVISSIVRNREEWNSDLYQAMPFYQRVQQEGIRL